MVQESHTIAIGDHYRFYNRRYHRHLHSYLERKTGRDITNSGSVIDMNDSQMALEELGVLEKSACLEDLDTETSQ